MLNLFAAVLLHGHGGDSLGGNPMLGLCLLVGFLLFVFIFCLVTPRKGVAISWEKKLTEDDCTCDNEQGCLVHDKP